MQQRRKLVPPAYLLLALIAMMLLHRLAPVADVVEAPYSYAGAVFVIAGLLITGTAARAFHVAGTPLIPFERSTTLVTDGLYRHTRNPMYLGLVLILVGAWLLLGSVSALLPLAAFLWIIQRRFIRAEELFLEEIFGAAYVEYKRRVRRWL